MQTTKIPTVLEQLLGQDLEHQVREAYQNKMYDENNILLEAVIARHPFHKEKLYSHMKWIYNEITENQVAISIEDYIGWIENSLI
jgi:hypothetical protein